MKRNATAIWYGSGQDGNGKLTTQSEMLREAQYSYKTRFEDGVGTNPEELIAAAHAGCFTMKLAFILDTAGFEAESIETTCSIELKDGVISSSSLDVKAKIPNIQKNKLDELVTNAEKNCTVSKVLNTTIFVDVHLEN